MTVFSVYHVKSYGPKGIFKYVELTLFNRKFELFKKKAN